MLRRAVFCAFAVCVALASLVQGQTALIHDQAVVCYVATWAVYRQSLGKFTLDDVDPTLCTHIVYSFLGIDDKKFTLMPLDHEYDVNKGGFQKAVGLRKKNPKLKVTIAVGGWTEGSEKYSAMASNSVTRKAFIDSAVQFLKKYDFDGLDLDWEYPANRGGKPVDKQNFVLLVKEMREVFDRNNWLLTAAVGAGKSTIDSAYDIPEISKYLDYIHLMAYDYHGRWDMKTGHNAPLYPRLDETLEEQMLNVNFSVRYYLSLGAPIDKFILGLGLYGRTFLLNDTSDPGIGAQTRKSAFAGPYTREDGFLGYNEICEKLINEKRWGLAWQEAHQAPYMFRDNMWISFDDANSLGVKVAFAQRLGLAGVMVWSLDTDDFSGQCGARYPLLNAINKNMALHVKDRFKEKVDVRTTQRPVDKTQGPQYFDLDKDKTQGPHDFDLDKDKTHSPHDFGLDNDKPGMTNVDFHPEDNNNDIENSKYYPANYPVKGQNNNSLASTLSLSIAVIMSVTIASLFAA